VAVATGEGTADERAHVRECARCAARCAGLTDDLGLLRQALLVEPPPTVARATRAGWLPVGAAMAAAALLALVWAAPWRPPHAPQPVRVVQVAGLARDVSAALFAPVRPVAVVQPATDSTYLQAAINGGWPCGGLGRYGIDCQSADPLAYYDR
jgi:hypothetical protein